MFYITAASSITHQPTFRNAGFSGSIKSLHRRSELLNPNYKEYIDSGLLRRMSRILRMSVANAKECLSEAGIEQPDSIVVGTGLGCLQDTEKFLNTFLTVEGLLPPTSFIQSTHNTMAGQISLSIGNHGYNMTHTQNILSFEHALIDSMLLLGEEDKNVLVGAADEYIEILDKIGYELNPSFAGELTTGASFFVVSSENSPNALARLIAVEVFGLETDIAGKVKGFMTNHGLKSDELDLVFFSGVDLTITGQILSFFNSIELEESKLLNYLDYSGVYATASAFGLHYAVDRLRENKSFKRILIINYLNKINLGLTLIESIET